MRVGLAGRSADKLHALRERLPGSRRDWPVLAAQTRALVSAVGAASASLTSAVVDGPERLSLRRVPIPPNSRSPTDKSGQTSPGRRMASESVRCSGACMGENRQLRLAHFAQ